MNQNQADYGAIISRLTEERDAERVKNRRLNKRIGKLGDIRDKYLALAVTRNRKLDALSSEYDSHRTQNREKLRFRLNAERDERQRRERSEVRIRGLEARRQQSRERTARLNDEITRLRKALQGARGQLTNVRAERDDSIAIRRKLRKRIAKLKSVRDEYQTLSIQRYRENERLNTDAQKFSNRLTADKTEIARLRKLLGIDRGRYVDLSKKNEANLAEIERLRKRQVRLIGARNEYQEGNRKHLAEIDRLRKRQGRLIGARDEYQEGNRKHLAEIDRLRKRQGRLISARDEYQEGIRTERAKVARLTKELNDEVDSGDNLRSEVKRLKLLVGNSQTSSSKLRDNFKEASARNDALRNRVKRLVGIRDNSQAKARKQQLEINTLQDSLRLAQANIIRLNREVDASIADEGVFRAQCDQRVAQCRNEQIATRTAAARACEERLQKIASAGRILFASSSAALTRSSRPTLNRLAAAIENCSGYTVLVEGHTDASGDEDENLILSRERAGSVVTYLVDRGVARASLKANGFGQTRPIEDNATVAGRSANRRIEFRIER